VRRIQPEPAADDTRGRPARQHAVDERADGAADDRAGRRARDGRAGASADQGALSDAQIASILDTVNRGEEKEAVLAAAKAKDTKVKMYAQMMMTGHRDANRRLMVVVKKVNITPAQTSLSTQLDNDVTQKLDELRNKQGADFDKLYMDDQVKMHTQVLDLIDNRLLPNVKDANIKSELQQLRASIADHLRRAQDIQSSLSNAPTMPQPQGGQQPSGGQQYPR
jgi:putative membrane protein